MYYEHFTEYESFESIVQALLFVLGFQLEKFEQESCLIRPR